MLIDRDKDGDSIYRRSPAGLEHLLYLLAQRSLVHVPAKSWEASQSYGLNRSS